MDTSVHILTLGISCSSIWALALSLLRVCITLYFLSSDFYNASFQEMLQPHQHPYFPCPCISQQKTCLAACQRCIFWNIFVLFFRLSGFMLPSPVVSSGSILALWFTTDFAVSAQGFKAVYEGKTMCEGAYDVWIRDTQTISESIVMTCKVINSEL